MSRKIWSVEELETLPAGTKERTSHHRLPGGERHRRERQQWGEVWEIEWSAYGLYWVHRYHVKPDWTKPIQRGDVSQNVLWWNGVSIWQKRQRRWITFAQTLPLLSHSSSTKTGSIQFIIKYMAGINKCSNKICSILITLHLWSSVKCMMINTEQSQILCICTCPWKHKHFINFLKHV